MTVSTVGVGGSGGVGTVSILVNHVAELPRDAVPTGPWHLTQGVVGWQRFYRTSAGNYCVFLEA